MREQISKLRERIKDEEGRYTILRWTGNFVAGAAILSLMLHLVLHGGSVNQIKCIFFGAVLIAWFVAMPLTLATDPRVLPIRPPERLWALQRSLMRQVYPFGFITAFLWFALTRW
jgi:hypothetical protein